jgi:hypothetical protein
MEKRCDDDPQRLKTQMNFQGYPILQNFISINVQEKAEKFTRYENDEKQMKWQENFTQRRFQL